MNKKRFLRLFGLLLFFGLCITMLSKGADVLAADNAPKLNVSKVSIIKGGSYRLKVYNLASGQQVIYRSGDTSVASVSRTGKVTGISCGSAVVTATVVEAGRAVETLQCDVVIGPAAVSIRLTKTNLVLKEGKMKALRSYIIPLNTVEVPTYYSTDREIAKVTSAGRIYALTEGTVEVYAFLANGSSAVCKVTVLNEENYAKYLEGATIEELLDLEAQDEEVADTEAEDTVDTPTEAVSAELQQETATVTEAPSAETDR